MAGLKRKESPASHSYPTDVRKKPKKETVQVNLEAETDSDPIVESDTTDHSGDDDGVSWPSDEEDAAPNGSGKEQKPRKASATGNEPVEKSTDANICKIH